MKKILSLALALMMLCVAAVPAMAADAATDPTAVHYVALAEKIPSINGTMADGEWGDPVYKMTVTNPLDKEIQIEYYMLYSEAEIYVACKVIGDEFAKGIDHKHSSSLIPRFDRNCDGSTNDDGFVGYIAMANDGFPNLNGLIGSAGNGKMSNADGVTVFEVSLPQSALGKITLAEGTSFIADFWYWNNYDNTQDVYSQYNTGMIGMKLGAAPADTTPADTTPADTTPADTTPADTTPADTTPADTTKPADTQKPADTDAPATFDAFVIVAVVAAASAAGVVVSKKRK